MLLKLLILDIDCHPQIAVFRADNKVRKTTTVLRNVVHGDVEAGEIEAWEGSIDSIPWVPPSRLGGGCKLIEVKYQLLVSMYSLSCSILEDIECPA